MTMELNQDQIERLLAFKRVRLLGHNLFVRKCQLPDIKDKHGKVLVALTDHTKNQTNWAEILLVGPEVGKRRDRKTCERLSGLGNKCERSYGWNPKPGDFVVLPEMSANHTMWREPIGGNRAYEHDLIVDECNVIVWFPKENMT